MRCSSGTYLSRDVGLRAGVGVEPWDGQLWVGERGAAAPQLLLRAQVQLETILQHCQFLQKQRQSELQVTGRTTGRMCSEESGPE